jgi:hypothetical protein
MVFTGIFLHIFWPYAEKEEQKLFFNALIIVPQEKSIYSFFCNHTLECVVCWYSEDRETTRVNSQSSRTLRLSIEHWAVASLVRQTPYKNSQRTASCASPSVFFTYLLCTQPASELRRAGCLPSIQAVKLSRAETARGAKRPT